MPDPISATLAQQDGSFGVPGAAAAPSEAADPNFIALNALAKRGAPRSLYEDAAVAAGLDPKYGEALRQFHQVESNGNWHPKASSTGAQGPFQFTKGTWGQYGQGDVLDPHDNTYAAARLMAANRAALTKSLGREPTFGELGLAHQQGASGATALINNPDATAGDLVGGKAVSVNGGNPNQTAGSFAQKWINAYGKTQDVGGSPSLLPPSGKDASELALDAMSLKMNAWRKWNAAESSGDPEAAKDWSFGMQMLDSLLQGYGPSAMQSLPNSVSGGKSEEELENARTEWQKTNKGKTLASDLTVGSVPALAATAATEGVAAPLLGKLVPHAASVLDFLTGKAPGLLSKLAQGGEQGAIAGAISQQPGSNAENGAETGELMNLLTHGAGKLGSSAGKLIGGLAHSSNAIPLGLAAVILGHDPAEIAHMVYQHPELATAILGGAGVGAIMNRPGVRNAASAVANVTSPNPLINAGVYMKPEGPFSRGRSDSVAKWFGVE